MSKDTKFSEVKNITNSSLFSKNNVIDFTKKYSKSYLPVLCVSLDGKRHIKDM